MRVVLTLMVVLAAATACGSAQQGSSGPPQTAHDYVSGIYVHRASPDEQGGKPVQGVVIGAYPRPISTAGPIMADPPQPIAKATTGSGGRFVIHVPGHARVFLAPLRDTAYAVGKWAQVGGGPVLLSGCTRCMRPLASQANTG